MPLRKLKFENNGIYHICNRGVSKQTIHHTHQDFERMANLLFYFAKKYDIELIAWCLMPNHYHLLIRQNADSPAGKFVQYAMNAYAKYYNHVHKHSGHVFESAFKARQIRTEKGLSRIARYILMNPVNHGFVDNPMDWAFSASIIPVSDLLTA